MRRLWLTVILGLLSLPLFAHSAEAFSIYQQGEKTMVETLLPWNDIDQAEIERKIKALAVRIRSDQKYWDLPVWTERASLIEGKYAQFGPWELPLSENETLDRFGIVRKRLMRFEQKSLEEKINQDVAAQVEEKREDIIISTGSGGTILLEGKAVDGRRLDTAALLSNIYTAIEQGQDTVDAPVTTERGQVHKIGLEDLNIKELIATGMSDFAGSPPNRITNIAVGVARFNGVVIKQGETFSFNTQLGPVDARHGFEPELVILGPRTEKEFGGGLCQVSSTMFRAALYAGLPIAARRNHSYAVQYYKWPHGWGFDATIYPGSQDMKFVNDTPGDILVQAYIEGTRVYYKFYGIKDGRNVEVSDPRIYNQRGVPATQTWYTEKLPAGKSRVREKPHSGFTASFTRNVMRSDGTQKKETFVSVYQPRPQVIEMGGTDPNAIVGESGETYYTGDIGG